MFVNIIAYFSRSTEKIAKTDVLFQLATKAVSYFIEHFGMRDLFGRENYEYYARLTGRILKVEVGEDYGFKIRISISILLLLRTNGSSSRTPWTTSGSELTLTLSAGAPASDQVTRKCLRQVSVIFFRFFKIFKDLFKIHFKLF